MKNYDPNFKSYLTAGFPVHAKKIFKAHSQAWMARIFYPFFFILIPSLFFGFIALTFYFFKNPFYHLFDEQDSITRMLKDYPLNEYLILIAVIGACFVLLSFIIGLNIGLERGISILFEGEKLHIETMHLWIAEENKTSLLENLQHFQSGQQKQMPISPNSPFHHNNAPHHSLQNIDNSTISPLNEPEV